jgi:hypothetical protein
MIDIQKLLSDRSVGGKRWRYDGVGWPRAGAEIRPWIPGTVLLVALTIWGYVTIGPNGRLEPGRTHEHRTDFTVFTEAGAAFFDGRDPYQVTNPRGWHYLYPPLFALLVAPLSVFDTESQVVIWYAVNVLLTIGCFCEARRLWRLVCADDPRRFHWVAGLAALAAFLPFLDCMEAGQLGIAILYLLMLGFRNALQARSRGRWFLGGLILALPAAVKLVPAFPVAFLVVERWWAVARTPSENRPWKQAAILSSGVLTGVFLFLFAIPASLIGWRSNLDYLDQWRARIVTNERVGADANFNIHSFRNQSLANAVYLWDRATVRPPRPGSRGGFAPDRAERIAHPAARILVGVVLAALFMASWSLCKHSDVLDRATAFGLASCAMLLISPLSWGHYYMAQLPAILLVPIWLLRRGREFEAKVVAVTPVVLSWAYYVAMPFTGGFGLLGLGTTAWFLGACGLVVSCQAKRRRGWGRRHRFETDDVAQVDLDRPIVELVSGIAD